MAVNKKDSAKEPTNQGNNTTLDSENQNIVFVRKRVRIPRNGNSGAIIRIDDAAAGMLENIASETGIPVIRIASQLITWAADRTSFVDEVANGGGEYV